MNISLSPSSNSNDTNSLTLVFRRISEPEKWRNAKRDAVSALLARDFKKFEDILEMFQPSMREILRELAVKTANQKGANIKPAMIAHIAPAVPAPMVEKANQPLSYTTAHDQKTAPEPYKPAKAFGSR